MRSMQAKKRYKNAVSYAERTAVDWTDRNNKKNGATLEKHAVIYDEMVILQWTLVQFNSRFGFSRQKQHISSFPIHKRYQKVQPFVLQIS